MARNSLFPAKPGRRSTMPDIPDDVPLVAATFRLPDHYWHRVRLIAAASQTSPVSVVKQALDRFLADEMPKVRTQIDKLSG